MGRHSEWLARAVQQRNLGCQTCRNAEAATTTREILEDMIANGVRFGQLQGQIPAVAAYQYVRDLHPDYRLSDKTWLNHVRTCERALYDRIANGRA